MKRIFSVLAMLCPFFSMCQPITINGKIISEQSEPIAGATITIKGTNRSTTSNSRGEFTLRETGLFDTLVVSSVGYEPQEVPNNERGLITVILQRKATALQEVTVNTGYQALSRERAAGSFEVLSNKAFNLQVGHSVLDRLEGAITSVAFNKGSSQPPLTVRGISTIHGSKAPLVILDDFPYEGDMANINPNDVETVNLLKDAAAASIWGTRAGNGVIVITTKKGRTNSPMSVELNVNSVYTGKPDLFYTEQLSSADFVELEAFLFSKGFYNSRLTSTARPAVSPAVEILAKKKAGQITEVDAEAQLNALKTHDVRDDFLQYIYKPSIKQQYALNIRGGAPRLAWLLSAGYDRSSSETALASDRFSLRWHNSYQLLKNLQFNLAALYTQTETRSGRPSYGSLAAANLYPYTQLADASGNALPITRSYRLSYLDTAGGGHLLPWTYYPLEDYKHNRTKTLGHDLLVNLGLSYRLAKSLTLDLKYSREQQHTVRQTLQGLQSYYTRDLVNRFSQVDYASGAVTYRVPKGDILDRDLDGLLSQAFRTQLNWDKRWQTGGITAIAGGEIRELHTTGSSYRLYGYDEDLVTHADVDHLDTYPTFINGAKASIPSGLSLSDKLNRFVSFYANAAYTLHSRYTLTASARRDASNLFGVKTNDKWQPLWSAGAAWNLSKESWYHWKALPYLKFRVTYGFNGNVDQSRAAVTTIAYLGAPASFTNLPQAYIRQFANPQLRWERVGTVNYGIDFESGNRILSGSLEYYIKKGKDLFGNAPIDYTTGAGIRLLKNVADMKGRGIDLTLHSKNIDRAFQWNTTLLGSYNSSKVTRYHNTTLRGFDHVSNGNSITALEGKPVYSVLSFQWAGLDSLGNPRGLVKGLPTTVYGDITGAKTTIEDLVYSGPALPTIFGSLQNHFGWKGIALTLAIQYKLGYYFRKTSIDYGMLFSQATGHSDYALRWKAPGDEKVTSVPSLIYPNNSSRDRFYNNSEVLVEKGDHLRLQFIHLTYDLPARISGRSLKSMQFYVNASNLGILWKATDKDIDPEYGTSIPPSASIAFGIRTNF